MTLKEHFCLAGLLGLPRSTVVMLESNLVHQGREDLLVALQALVLETQSPKWNRESRSFKLRVKALRNKIQGYL